MRRKKQRKLLPPVEATPIVDAAALRMLRDLSDEALDIELKNATTTEGWLRTTEATLRAEGPPALADLAEHGAAYCRVAREVMLVLVADRAFEKQAQEAKENGEKKKGGYL
jgi:hypothetical protein